MLAYFKNYRAMCYAISFGVPIVIIGVLWLAFGINLMSGIYGGITFLVCMLLLLFITGRYFSSRAEREAEEALAQYNEKCDPEAFRAQGKQAAAAIYGECYARGTTELGAWFLAPFALACIDTGATEDAQMMEQMMLEHIPEGTPNAARAGILINIEPLTLRLHGANDALTLAREAQELLVGNESDEVKDKIAFLNFEISLLNSLANGDTDKLRSLFEGVVVASSTPQRIRVLDYDALGGILEGQGDIEGARRAYQFVIDNGNKLPVVNEARVKIERL